MSRPPPSDPSIEHEPQRRGGHETDPSEARAATTLARAGPGDDPVEHSVWDEPALSPELAGERDRGYARWLVTRQQQVSAARSWMVTALAAIVAGPFAVIGALLGGGQSLFSLLAITVFGPLAEEMMKIAAPLYIVEKRPYLFRAPAQIVICGLSSGLAFAAIENAIYLEVYVSEPSALLASWRWSVCVLLHSGCTVISSLGLRRVWCDAIARQARPSVGLASSYVVTAALIHGLYNGLMVALSMADYRF